MAFYPKYYSKIFFHVKTSYHDICRWLQYEKLGFNIMNYNYVVFAFLVITSF